MEDLRVWHRRHRPDLIAEVTPGVDSGTWDICVFREPGHRDLEAETVFGNERKALRAADTFVSETFGHRCDAACGPWRA